MSFKTRPRGRVFVFEKHCRNVVVPAKAGTHNHRFIGPGEMAENAVADYFDRDDGSRPSPGRRGDYFPALMARSTSALGQQSTFKPAFF